MKVITIGSDTKLFDEQSPVLDRQIQYASRMEELHIVVRTLSTDPYEVRKINNLTIYPTQSFSKITAPYDAYALGAKIILENQFVRGDSVISSQDPFESGFVSHALSRRFRLPFQIQIHTDFFSEFFTHSIANRIRKMISSYILPRAHGVRVVSQSLADMIERTYAIPPTRVSVLPIFVDVLGLGHIQPRLNAKVLFPQFNFIFFMSSRLTEEKEIMTAVEAFGSVAQGTPRTGLIIAGSGPEEKKLKQKVFELGLTDRILFIGWQEDLISYYKTVDTFVQTSRYEGYGMAFVEAGASGCPVITTPVGVAQTICKDGENSFICPVGDVQCFARAMNDMISVNSYRKLFKLAMQDSISVLAVSQTEYVEQYVHILEKIRMMPSV